MRLFLILILILVYPLQGEERITKIKLVEAPITPVIDVLYNSCIEHLKEREGFKSNPYKCPAGQLTIGYGTKAKQIKEVNEQQADSLLRIDFDKAINKVSNEFIDFDCNKVYALAMLVHNVGFKNFKYNKNGKYTKLYLQLKDNEKPTNWLKFNRIGNKKSKRLIKSREYEYTIYNNSGGSL
jgi:GH24 family phage-related lysozyme (muramidase)